MLLIKGKFDYNTSMGPDSLINIRDLCPTYTERMCTSRLELINTSFVDAMASVMMVVICSSLMFPRICFAISLYNIIICDVVYENVGEEIDEGSGG